MYNKPQQPLALQRSRHCNELGGDSLCRCAVLRLPPPAHLAPHAATCAPRLLLCSICHARCYAPSATACASSFHLALRCFSFLYFLELGHEVGFELWATKWLDRQRAECGSCVRGRLWDAQDTGRRAAAKVREPTTATHKNAAKESHMGTQAYWVPGAQWAQAMVPSTLASCPCDQVSRKLAIPTCPAVSLAFAAKLPTCSSRILLPSLPATWVKRGRAT